jgi:hypothetical protein
LRRAQPPSHLDVHVNERTFDDGALTRVYVACIRVAQSTVASIALSHDVVNDDDGTGGVGGVGGVGGGSISDGVVAAAVSLLVGARRYARRFKHQHHCKQH